MTEITTQVLLNRILCADRDELNEIISAVTERFWQIWPDWDLLVISCEGRTPEAHVKTLQQSIQLLSNVTKNDLP